ncbi:chromosomal replication initiator protein DnaA [Ornithobacterium rhinotracheale]|uniref:chromosomal replication initiator protein DnaA n=1 Tax=Ornithobacterium rhinotracheale TaxID=28251 RepID=UPI00129C1F1A|nr:chromosomal replication initiator protein DnaA [Ornithobacterium rhinotracheale]MRI62951.1 chromosomal replication initiator protein DnaA [Ornithobacterium rhinotracheale]MRJ08654.1 chromosomal replication initiator protein DnaA [Ornithobacterium rhinotracheale]MRJ10997.1 chromosomal replication initiator protein DnaA [Ornithobacterium rhinotracheale]UOH76900.1 chromosomal replication initiator protein DnaA [Ornithobacterium rhinotracheale]
MSVTAASVWSKCLEFIKDNIEPSAYETWFEPIKAIKLDADRHILTIQVPSTFFYEWIEEHYLNLVKTALVKELGAKARLNYSAMVVPTKNAAGSPVMINMPSSNKTKVKPQEVNAPIKTGEITNPFAIPGIQKIKINSQLNDNLNFNTFIQGETNQLARSAGMAVAKHPGATSFNPLFIYGGVGLGKTHLAHAIGLEIKDKYPDKTVLYVSMEKFSNQYRAATVRNNRNDFVNFYQMIDVLIIDDVQFLSGKKGTQEVFFHIFEDLHRRGNQLILTSDKPPVDIQDVEQRLISRFKWGLSADLQSPEFELRKNILLSKLEQNGIELPEEVTDFIAEKIKTNIRELEGALNSLIAQSLLIKKEITLELAERVLSNLVKNQRKEITIDYIQKVVCDYFKIPVEKMQSKSRKSDIAEARHLAMYFARKYTNASLASIGAQIGKRDHATVLHSCKTAKNLLETDKRFKSYVEEIKRKIGAE